MHTYDDFLRNIWYRYFVFTGSAHLHIVSILVHMTSSLWTWMEKIEGTLNDIPFDSFKLTTLSYIFPCCCQYRGYELGFNFMTWNHLYLLSFSYLEQRYPHYPCRITPHFIIFLSRTALPLQNYTTHQPHFFMLHVEDRLQALLLDIICKIYNFNFCTKLWNLPFIFEGYQFHFILRMSIFHSTFAIF